MQRNDHRHDQRDDTHASAASGPICAVAPDLAAATVPVSRLFLVTGIADPTAPTVDELSNAIDITSCLR